MKAMILAAGIGSRLKPLTDNTPKALVKVGEYKMLDLAIAYLSKHGITQFIINVHHLADQLMEYVAEKRWEGFDISISNETGALMNTGGGLVHAKDFFTNEDNFVLMAVDILTNLNLAEMIKRHTESNALVTLAVKDRNTSRSLMFDKEGNLAGWRHNSTGEVKQVVGREQQVAKGFSGIHVINAALFNKISENGAFSIIDMYLRLAEAESIKMFDHSEGMWLEFGRAELIPELVASEEFISLVTELMN